MPAPKLNVIKLRSIPSGIWALGFVSMLMDISSEMIHALLPVYFVSVLAASATTVGVIEGIAEATASVTKVISGALSDRLGKRKLLAAWGYGLAALSKPIFPIASSIAWLAAARFMDRFGKGMRGAPRDALVAEMAPEHLRGTSFGLRQSLDTAGAVIGPLVGIGLMWLTANRFRFVFWVAVIPAVLALLLMIFAVREPERPKQLRKVRLPLHRAELARLGRSYWMIIAVATVFTLARFSEAFLVLRAQAMGVPVMLVPGVFVVMNVVYALSAYPAGILADNGGRYTSLVLGISLLGGADLVLAFLPGIVGVAAGVALWGLHLGFTQGLLSTLVADNSPPELRGTAFGVFNLVTGGALLVASLLAGLLWDRLGAQATYLVGTGLVCMALIGLRLIRRHVSVSGCPR